MGPWWEDNPIDRAIAKFKEHPSIKKIKNTFIPDSKFEFKLTNEVEVKKLITSIDTKKRTSGAIPPKVLKNNSDICSKIISNCINRSIKNGIFPTKLKQADIIPVHKKDDTTVKSNYRPISILPTVSKIFEKVIYSQIEEYMQAFLNPILCGFRKGYSSQHAILNLLQNWQIPNIIFFCSSISHYLLFA